MRLANEGSRVQISGDDERGLRESSALIRGGEILLLLNKLDPDTFHGLVADTEFEFGPIDNLVDNLGVLLRRP